ncbi:hypothetical protein C5B42_02165 [Candidatus Cerribacteria bacterium 'Amazon FNV 2010 28 9']|uniref:Histidine phosphatase family protein n=1 Tax=Candidatus Cerribacteria bacterium 'Amazon FNV 2010 28 9' TaxID=2081795 RepID=A0A317JPN8_9BACT|nr:MAG: hypothetical protein C5B42_02165 [Candidatus Cerribacteria bacterium 'Amazon FNV 2010 28 9']
MTIYLVRHGQTNGNVNHLHQTLETPLNEIGLDQAEKVSKRFAHTSIDVILASPATRAQQTAKEVQTVTRANLETLELLAEQRHPSEIDNLSWEHESTSNVWKAIDENLHDKSYHYSDEENNSDFIERISHIFPLLEKRKEENIVLVSHGFVIRCLVGLLMFEDDFSSKEYERAKQKLWTVNTGITVFKYTTENGWGLLTYNDHAHLLE